MCHYGDLEYLSYTPAVIRVDPRVGENNSDTSYSDADVSKNDLPFDIDLFVDNGEIVNPNCQPGLITESCRINGYFRRALYDRLSLFTEQDRGIFDKMNYRIPITSDDATPYRVIGSLGQGGGSMNYGFGGYPDAWSFDYIEKLGGIVALAEEARFMNPELKPAGDMVSSHGGQEVYLRGGQVFFNNYVVSNRPRVKPDGSDAEGSRAGYDDFMKIGKAINLMMSESRTILSGSGPRFEFSPLFACLRYQNERGMAFDPDEIVSDRPYYQPPGTRNVNCRIFAREHGLSFKDPLPSGDPDNSIGIDPIKEARAASVFDEFWKLFASGGDSLINIIIGCQESGRYQDCISSRRASLDERFEEFYEKYDQLRDVYGVQIANYNPTLHCSNGRCLVTFISGTTIYAGISEGGADITRIIDLPLDGETFNQVSHRGFITRDGRVVVVYSALDQDYKILIFNPYTQESSIISTGVGYLSSLDADIYESLNVNPKLLIAYYQEGQSTVNYREYDINSRSIWLGRQNSVNFGRVLFPFFRPGPALSVKYGNGVDSDFHLVAPTFLLPSFEGFDNDVSYAYVQFDGNQYHTELITTNQEDREKLRIPAGDGVFASRIFSNTAKSIYVTPSGEPIVVWINRIANWTGENGQISTDWETQYQAFLARKVASSWMVVPISDRVPGVLKSAQGLLTEIKNVFISDYAVGMTVDDAVSKRNSKNRMLDGAGPKRCVYNQDFDSVVENGSTDCGTLMNIQYIKPNKGNWEFCTFNANRLVCVPS